MRAVVLVGGLLVLAASGCSSSSKAGDEKGDGGGTDIGGVALTPKCTTDDLVPAGDGVASKACSSYVTPTVDGAGVLTEFGPYGAVMEPNVGQDFAIPPSPQDTKANCDTIGASFGEDPTLTAQVMDLRGTDLSLYTVFRPARWVDGEKYPIITWGNGTCAQPGSYAALLMHLASYGFFIVAANGRFVANGAQVNALDFVFAANEDPSSPYYHRLDTTKVGAMGHSQGSAATIAAAADSRINVVALWNGGTTASKPFLGISADRDIGAPTADTYRTGVMGAPEAGFVFMHNVPETGGKITGHLVLMMHPERVVDFDAGWWKYMLKGDAKAKDMFVGTSCGLCTKNSDYEYGENGLK